MNSVRVFSWVSALALLASGAACSPATSMPPNDEGQLDVDDGGTGDQKEGGIEPSDPDGGTDADEACAEEGSEATLRREPVDIVFLVDNSASLRPQIERVQETINANFAKVLDDARLDYRVILISQHGDYRTSANSPVCIEAPLSGIPAQGCESPPAEPADNPPKFFHYSYRIRNNDAVQVLLHGFDNPDEHGRAPNGWSAWLRPEVLKSFLVLTDGRINCSYDGIAYNDGNSENHAQNVASMLDEKLRTMAPEHFGALDEERRYRFYSIVSMAPNEPADAPYAPTEPLITSTCSETDVNPGLGYQALSRLSGGARFPLCQPSAFASIFRTIAEDLISGSPIECDFPIPEPPPGQVLDRKRVAVEYTPSDGGEPILFAPVEDASACRENAFYLDGENVRLCAESCDRVQSDDAAKVRVLFDCAVILR